MKPKLKQINTLGTFRRLSGGIAARIFSETSLGLRKFKEQ